MKYLICPLIYGFVYFISGTGIEQKYKDWLKKHHLWRIAKELVRRKNLMALATFIVLSLFTSLAPPQKLLCSLALWLVHFIGWWEMSIIRGLVEGLALIPMMFYLGANNLPILCCVVGFFGAKALIYYDPHIGIDWWWICSTWIGAWIGLGVSLIL